MATTHVDDSSLPADLQTKWVGLVWGSAAVWRSVCIHQMNRVNSCSGLAMMTAPKTLSLVLLVVWTGAREHGLCTEP